MEDKISLFLILSVSLLSWKSVFSLVDLDGYDRAEFKLCSGSSIGQYDHNKNVPIVPDDCKVACLAKDGCIAFSVNTINENCPLFDSCDDKQDNALYTTYITKNCGPPPGLANGRATATSFYSNTAAGYKCMDDYVLDGTDGVKCDADGKWTGEEPTCKYEAYHNCDHFCEEDVKVPIECDNGFLLDITFANFGRWSKGHCGPPSVATPTPDCKNYQSNEEVKKMCNDKNTCTIDTTKLTECDEGFDEDVHVEWKCVDDRENVQKCEATCNLPNSFENGLASLELHSQGARARFECNAGYETADDSPIEVIECVDNEPETTPTCTKISCPEITVDGVLYDENAPRTFGSTVIVSCHEGYSHTGVSNVVCQADKSWHGAYTCDPVDCGAIVDTNADVVSDDDTTFTAQATIICKTGYEFPSGSNLHPTTCQKDGTWSFSEKCQAVDCKGPPDADENGSIGFDPDTVDTTFPQALTYTCNEGYVPLTATITCGADMQWVGAHTCTAVLCPDPSQETTVGGVQTSNDFKPQSVAVITCIEGYEFLPSSSTICQDSGEWNPAIACDKVSCGSPDVPENANIGDAGEVTLYGTLIWVWCNPGYEVEDGQNVLGIILCHANKEWSKIQQQCSIVSCGDPAEITDGSGDVKFTTTTFDSTVKYTCDPGYSVSGSSDGTCLDSKKWSIDPPKCIALKCADIQPASGHSGLSDAVAGSTYNFTCDAGFILDGSDILNCLINGIWDTDIPSCHAVECLDPDSVPLVSSAAMTNRRGYKSVVTVTCNEGHEFLPDGTATCEQNELWNPVISCQKKDCGSPGSIAHADLEVSGTVYEFQARYTCHTGYETNDGGANILISCLSNGEWSTRDTCLAVNCGNPQPTTGAGQIIVTTTTYGSTVTYKCDAGYLLVGDISGTCNENKKWSIDPPNCELILCPSISSGAGQPGLDNAITGTVLSYNCDEGYNLIGSEKITCLVDGTWDDDVPSCEPVSCTKVSSTLENGAVTIQGTTFGQHVSYKCDEGYKPSGNGIITCRKDGTWSDDPPTCSSGVLRIISSAKSTLDCDDYNKDGLQALLSEARKSLPDQLVIVIRLTLEKIIFSIEINIIGIRCNSPLSFLLEVNVVTTENETSTEQTVVDALEQLTSATAQLAVNGEDITIQFTDVISSDNTDKICGQGYFTDVTSLECSPCVKDTYQPTGIQELCLHCPDNKETEGIATYGDEGDVCKADQTALTIGLSIGLPLAVILLLIIAAMLYLSIRNSRLKHNALEEMDADIYSYKLGYRRGPINNMYGRNFAHQSPYNW